MQKKVVTDEKFQRQLNLELEMSLRGRRKVERIYAKAKSDKNESITLYGQSLMRTQLNAVSSSTIANFVISGDILNGKLVSL